MRFDASFLVPFVIFIAVFSTIWGLAHYYLYKRFVSSIGTMSKGAIFVIELVFFLLGLSFPLTYILIRITRTPFVLSVYHISSIWMGVLFYLLLFSVAVHMVELILKRVELWDRLETDYGFDIPRTGMFVAIVLAVVVSAVALHGASRAPKVARLDVPVSRLPARLDGFKIVQLADLHLGANVGREKLERIVEITNLLEPDLVVITGDLIESEGLYMPTLLRPLMQIKSRYGVFAVMGNHEYYTFEGADKVVEIISKFGVKFLQNEVVRIAGGISLFGITDPDARIVGGKSLSTDELVERVVAKGNKSDVKLLLAHRPSGFRKAAELGVDLMLASHTHGGQLWPIGFLMKLFYPYTHGHYRLADSHLYVSCGAGTWGPPMRLGAPPEIAFITLKKAR